MKHFAFCTILFSILFSQNLRAGTWNLYGYGARNIGLGNSTASLETDAYSQVYNPALMALQPKALISASVQGALPRFEEINNVVVDTPNLGSTTGYPTGNFNTKTPDTFEVNLALQSPLSKSERPIFFGINVGTPVEKMIGIDMGRLFFQSFPSIPSTPHRQ